MISKEEQDYYDRGYFKTSLSPELMTLFWTEIYSTVWVEDSYEKIYKEIPEWYRIKHDLHVDSTGKNRSQYERDIGKLAFNNAPETLKKLSKLVLELPDLKFFEKYYKTSETIFIDLWNGAEEIPYHFDTINGADTLLLIYLTDSSTWKEEWGGKISVKKTLDDVIIYEDVWYPLSGNVLVINNTNPLVTHRVSKLINNDVNRYTFSFNYKWF